MTDEQAKALGERALALGMPWADGLMDGGDGNRIIRDVLDWSWPDLRDPVTEAWLVAWAMRAARSRLHEDVSADDDNDLWFYIVDQYSDTTIAQSTTRAETWILALEKLRGEQS